jgi:hypothetical protein
MRLRLGTLVLVASLATLAVSTTAAQSAPPTSNGLTTTLTGVVTDTTGAVVGTASSVANITGVTAQNGQLFATGTLTTTIRDLTGAVTNVVTSALNAPLAATGTCQILHLDLGPLDLTLLGLHVHLNEVVLDITAQQGPGNLLGNLLCAVAHLLDNSGSNTGGLAGLLNQLLGAL